MRVVKFIFDDIGNVFSANSISNFLKSEHRTVASETIYNYLEWLTEAFVIDKVSRYDLRGKAILKTQEKYYLGDISLLYALNGRNGFESYLPGILENIVYHELISHGYTVQIGKNGEKESILSLVALVACFTCRWQPILRGQPPLNANFLLLPAWKTPPQKNTSCL